MSSDLNKIDQIHKDFLIIVNESNFLKIVGGGLNQNIYDVSFGYNYDLQNTNYLADSKASYLHFTSLDKFENIIFESSLRMYNMHKSKDENEYIYASNILNNLYKLLNISEHRKAQEDEKLKSDLFYSSFSSMEGLHSKHHWQEYANKCKGVAIEFKIVDDYLKWEAIYFSSVKYGKRNEFENLINRLEKLHKKYQSYGCEFFIDLRPFFGLHKIDDYKIEDEYRILIDSGDSINEKIHELVFTDKEFGDNVKYLILPLYIKGSDNLLISDKKFSLPQLVINKIHYIDKTISKEIFDLKILIKDKLKYNVESQYSDFENQ